MKRPKFWDKLEMACNLQGFVIFSSWSPHPIGAIKDDCKVDGKPKPLPQPFVIIKESTYEEYLAQSKLIKVKAEAQKHRYFYKAVTD